MAVMMNFYATDNFVHGVKILHDNEYEKHIKIIVLFIQKVVKSGLLKKY